MLDAVGGVGQHLGDGDEHRHVLGKAAGHDAVHRHVVHGRGRTGGRQHSDAAVRRIRAMGEEPRHPLGGRRHDGEPIAPAPLFEDCVHVVEAALGDDVPGLRAVARGRGGHRRGEVPDDVGERHRADPLRELLVALPVDVPGNARDRQSVDAESAGDDRSLADEAVADERHRRHAASLDRRARPHHGGRARASGADAGDYRVDSVVTEP